MFSSSSDSSEPQPPKKREWQPQAPRDFWQHWIRFYRDGFVLYEPLKRQLFRKFLRVTDLEDQHHYFSEKHGGHGAWVKLPKKVFLDLFDNLPQRWQHLISPLFEPTLGHAFALIYVTDYQMNGKADVSSVLRIFVRQNPDFCDWIAEQPLARLAKLAELVPREEWTRPRMDVASLAVTVPNLIAEVTERIHLLTTEESAVNGRLTTVRQSIMHLSEDPFTEDVVESLVEEGRGLLTRLKELRAELSELAELKSDCQAFQESIRTLQAWFR